jgi:hypothetical protein
MFAAAASPAAPAALAEDTRLQATEAATTLHIGLSPVKTAHDLVPGETLTLTATFTNRGAVPVHARIRYADALVRSPARFEFQEPGGEFWSAGSWLKADPEAFTLEPGGRQEITLTVTVPDNTPDGQYYAAYFVEASSPGGGTDGSAVGIGGSLGAIVCLYVGENVVRSARLVPYHRVPRTAGPPDGWAQVKTSLVHWWRCLVIAGRNVALISEGHPLKVFVPIENTSDAYIQPRVTLRFYEGDVLRREVVYEGEIIMPGLSKVMEISWPDPPLFGRFRLKLHIEYHGPEPIQATRTFWVVPVKGLLGLVLLTFGLGYAASSRGRARSTRGRPPAAPGTR